MKSVIVESGRCRACGTETDPGHHHYCEPNGKSVRAVIPLPGASNASSPLDSLAYMPADQYPSRR